MTDKKTYVFDIDGTLCTNTNGLKDYVDAEPFLDRIEKVNDLYEDGNTVYLMTARGMGRNKNNFQKAYDQFYQFTLNQMESWGVKFHSLFLGKPAADFYVDDKAVHESEFFQKNDMDNK